MSAPVTEREAAIALGITVTQVRRLIAQGALPSLASSEARKGARGRPAEADLDSAAVARYAAGRKPRGRPRKGAGE